MEWYRRNTEDPRTLENIVAFYAFVPKYFIPFQSWVLPSHKHVRKICNVDQDHVSHAVRLHNQHLLRIWEITSSFLVAVAEHNHMNTTMLARALIEHVAVEAKLLHLCREQQGGLINDIELNEQLTEILLCTRLDGMLEAINKDYGDVISKTKSILTYIQKDAVPLEKEFIRNTGFVIPEKDTIWRRYETLSEFIHPNTVPFIAFQHKDDTCPLAFSLSVSASIAWIERSITDFILVHRFHEYLTKELIGIQGQMNGKPLKIDFELT